MKAVQTHQSASHTRQQVRWTWPGLLFALIALVGCAFAFVGLSSNSYWVDELYTLQIVDHQGGIAGVFQRVLTDVHPPLYYFILYGWTLLTGNSELSTRLLSAVCAVLALAVFAWGIRKRVSCNAMAFACAVATTSMFWFAQSENVRDYPLATLLSATLLAMAISLDQRNRTRTDFPLLHWLLLTLFGIAGSQTHPYMLLTVGVLLIFLMLTARTWSLRIALAGSGLVIVALYVGLLWLMAHKTGRHNYNDTWFSNKLTFLLSQLRRTVLNFANRQALLVIAGMLVAHWVRSRHRSALLAENPQEGSDIRWTTALCWFVCLGVIASGIAVSILIAPSLSYRNVLVCAPFGWFLVARLYDVAGPKLVTRRSALWAACAVILIGSQLVVLMRGRLLPANEPWRASAAYVQGMPGCSDSVIPVIVPPNTYAAVMTPDVRQMTERHYYGYYLPASYRLRTYLPEELLQTFATVQDDETAPSSCPLIAWTLHGIDNEPKGLALAEQLASTPELHGQPIAMQEFAAYQLHWLSWKPQPNGFVYSHAPLKALQAAAALPAGNDIDRKHSVGDLLLITDITPKPSPDGGLRSYAIQRWRNGSMIGQTRITRSLPSISNR